MGSAASVLVGLLLFDLGGAEDAIIPQAKTGSEISENISYNVSVVLTS